MNMTDYEFNERIQQHCNEFFARHPEVEAEYERCINDYFEVFFEGLTIETIKGANALDNTINVALDSLKNIITTVEDLTHTKIPKVVIVALIARLDTRIRNSFQRLTEVEKYLLGHG